MDWCVRPLGSRSRRWTGVLGNLAAEAPSLKPDLTRQTGVSPSNVCVYDLLLREEEIGTQEF